MKTLRVKKSIYSDPIDVWSSYRANALGKEVRLITPHPLYQELGNTNKERQKNYKSLFHQFMYETVVEEIRNSMNKGWVIGNDPFKKEIEKMAGRRAAPKPRGGDRKSKKFREGYEK